MNLELVKSVLNSDRVNDARKRVQVCPGTYPTNGIVVAGDGGTASHGSVVELAEFCEAELRSTINDPGADVSVIFDALADWSKSGPGVALEEPVFRAVYLNGEKVVN
jgi:hypothetical protein